MLHTLSIRNYALIDELNIQLGNKLNIITGETGAGKSIILGALSLLLGQRADSSALSDKEGKCIIEGEFSFPSSLKEYFVENELDVEKSILLRREITREGKSRAFVNDTPVNLTTLKEIGTRLVDVHSQHETLLLNNSGFQLSVVDSFAGIRADVDQFKVLFKDYQSIQKKLAEAEEREAKAKSEYDYLQFQFKELDEASLNDSEKSLLEEELKKLSHAEEIKNVLTRIDELISTDESNILSVLNQSVTLSSSVSKFHPDIDSLTERLKNIRVELKDISFEASSIAESTSADPQRAEVITERINLLNRLEQKHRVNDTNSLIRIRDSIATQLTSIDSISDEIEVLRKQLEKQQKELLKRAAALSEKRNAAIPGIEKKVKSLLSDLAMPNAILKIENRELEDSELNATGRDSIRFLFTANKGSALNEISKVASGGELSRLMLCLKAIVAKLIELPTIIFDEIDTGVSGETAYKIGKVMSELSASIQLVAITHLPQIASRGEKHYFVYKEISGKKTFTRVKLLSNDERVVEVARMLSGDKPTAIAMENAKELLKN